MLFWFLGFSARAQKVESKAFQLMLNELLSDTIPVVAVAELAEMKSPLLLDARSREEYAVSHLKNAVWVGHEDFSLERVPKNLMGQTVVVYCSIGLRSEEVAGRLIKAGYTQVYNLYGGIFEWLNQEQEIYNDAGPTDNIHPYNFAWGLWLREGKKSYE